MHRWEIEYDNDTGPRDEGFSEWWTVTNQTASFTTNSKDDAQWLMDTLNKASKEAGYVEIS